MFQFTLAYSERRIAAVSAHGYSRVSIHARVQRATRGRCRSRGNSHCFNSRSRTASDVNGHRSMRCGNSFNSRSRTASDLSCAFCFRRTEMFQFTLAYSERLVSFASRSWLIKFQFTLAYSERHFSRRRRRRGGGVSIHARVQRATCAAVAVPVATAIVSIHARVQRATCVCKMVQKSLWVSIHARVQRATCQNLGSNSRHQCFNSRSRTASDNHAVANPLPHLRFQFTLAYSERRAHTTRQRGNIWGFNSRSRTASDHNHVTYLWHFDSFNSRSRTASDLFIMYLLLVQ